MVDGRSSLLYQGYTFFFRYKHSKGHRWNCTRFPKCKAHLFTVEDRIVEANATKLIEQKNGKQSLYYDGYIFFYRYSTKQGQKWLCTHYPKCSASLSVDSNLRILKSCTTLIFYSYIAASIITLSTGKTPLYYDGQTYFKSYSGKFSERWLCTHHPKCKATIRVDKNLYVLKVTNKHQHPPNTLILGPDVQFITMMNGKINALLDGYTYYRRAEGKHYERWYCTMSPRCTAFFVVDKKGVLMETKTDHSHPIRQIIRLNDGRRNDHSAFRQVPVLLWRVYLLQTLHYEESHSMELH
ncbi:unnamed protein product [Colias eurytheme]|nr:unnamed protein product [Colias eurytheme]